MAGISFDEGEECREDGEGGQTECHRAAAAGERPPRWEHLAHGETTGRCLGEDSRLEIAGLSPLRIRQYHLPVSTTGTISTRRREPDRGQAIRGLPGGGAL